MIENHSPQARVSNFRNSDCVGLGASGTGDAASCQGDGAKKHATGEAPKGAGQ